MNHLEWVLEQRCEVSSMETPKTNQYGFSSDDATTKTADSSTSSLALDGTSSNLFRSIDRWPERVDTKVKFDVDNLTKIHWVPPRSDLSPEEFKEVWLGASDYTGISTWNRMTVKMIRQQGTLEEEPDHCIRGLEHRLKGQQRLRQTAKTNAIYGVLHEQSRQREHGYNVQKIADIYRGYAFGSDEEAKQKGIQDEIASKESVARPRRQLRRQSAVASSRRTFEEDDLRARRTFDEDDSMDARALKNGGEDEVDATETFKPHRKGDDDKPCFEEKNSGIIDEKVKKKSKVKRLKGYLKKIGSNHGKSEEPCRSISPIPPPPTRRLRRSSM
jgi:hypothetical protein